MNSDPSSRSHVNMAFEIFINRSNVPKQCKNKAQYREAGGEKAKGDYYCDYLVN